MSKPNAVLSAWQRISRLPLGKWAFTRFLCFKAPYFSSIRPGIEELRPGYCEVHTKKRRAVLNHIGTVHAIAMCNMAELAGGTMTEVTIPGTHRWIPTGMTVEYLNKAESDLRAIAKIDPTPALGDRVDLPVTVNIIDVSGRTVFRAVITMLVSLKNK